MTDDRKARRQAEHRAEIILRDKGIVITVTQHNEYRVNFYAGNEATAYYTPDLDDALATGLDMAKRRGV